MCRPSAFEWKEKWFLRIEKNNLQPESAIKSGEIHHWSLKIKN